jgi:predicted RNA-binding protein
MIIINLLPYHLRPIKRTPIPYILCALLVIAAISAMGLLFYQRQSSIGAARMTLQHKKDELEKLGDVRREYADLITRKKEIRDTVTVIREILSDRIIWSRQLHTLAALTPDNIWFSRIRVIEQTIQERRIKLDPKTRKPVINKKTKQPETELRRIKVPVLEISGYVINDENGESRIAPLTESTAEDPEFSSMFVLNRPQLEDTEFEGYSVRGFTLEYLIQRGNTEAEEGGR